MPKPASKNLPYSGLIRFFALFGSKSLIRFADNLYSILSRSFVLFFHLSITIASLYGVPVIARFSIISFSRRGSPYSLPFTSWPSAPQCSISPSRPTYIENICSPTLILLVHPLHFACSLSGQSDERAGGMRRAQSSPLYPLYPLLKARRMFWHLQWARNFV